jgi:hypothetical protein
MPSSSVLVATPLAVRFWNGTGVLPGSAIVGNVAGSSDDSSRQVRLGHVVTRASYQGQLLLRSA